MRIGSLHRAFLALFAAASLPAFALEDFSADSLFESEGSGMEIRSEPSGADVYLNGVFRGKTPLSLTGVLPGAQRIALEKDGYRTRRAVVDVPEGRRIEVRLKLVRATGLLRVEPPRGGGIDAPVVLIDGEPALIGDNEVDEGLHTVRLRAFGFEDMTRSVFVRGGEREPVEFSLRPAPFRVDSLKISRRRFNPANPGLLGTTVLSFQASAPGTASIAIRNAAGETVSRTELSAFDTWDQFYPWTGKAADGTPFGDGAYSIAVTARSIDGAVERTIETQAYVDSGIAIRPAAVSGDVGGLLFAPEARTIPSGSFQIDGTAFFGKPLGAAAFGAPPFALAFRFSPLPLIEAAGSLKADVSKEAGKAIAFGASVKRALLAPSRAQPIGLAAAARWTYAKEAGDSPFGNPPGIEASLPMELLLGETEAGTFSAHAAPALLWEGAEGMPDGTAPSAAAGGGISLRARSYTAAFSARAQADTVVMGLEARLFPQPSVLVFSAMGGAWLSADGSGFFAGAGLGIVY